MVAYFLMGRRLFQSSIHDDDSMIGGRDRVEAMNPSRSSRIWRRRNIFTADRIALRLSSFMAADRSGKQSKSLSLSLSK